MVVTIPKLKIPFQIVGTGASVVEQGSQDEIAQCVYAIMATERGSRLEEPNFGITDPTFNEGGMDLGEALLAIRTWEPRATVAAEQQVTEYLDQVTIRVGE